MATLACSSTGRKDWQRLAGMIACSMRRQCYSVLHIAFKQSRSRLIYRDDALHSLRKKTRLHTCTCTRTLTFESIYRCISQFSTLRAWVLTSAACEHRYYICASKLALARFVVVHFDWFIVYWNLAPNHWPCGARITGPSSGYHPQTSLVWRSARE